MVMNKNNPCLILSHHSNQIIEENKKKHIRKSKYFSIVTENSTYNNLSKIS